MSYRPATSCIVDAKSRCPRIIAYGMAEETTPKMMPPTTPMSSAVVAGVTTNEASRPMNRPSIAPPAIPCKITRPQVNRPVTRSTCMRSTPTMVTF